MPYYNLDQVREAALQQRIQYRGEAKHNKVRKDIANLGYTLDEVAQSIASLLPTDYQKTFEYPDSSFDDAYIKNVIFKDRIDRIYIKLRLLDNGEIQIIEIGSFHL